jgi:hypothetical protein
LLVAHRSWAELPSRAECRVIQSIRPTHTISPMLSAADCEIRLGIRKVHILHHAASREVWGKWLLDEPAEHGHELSYAG